MLKRFNPDVIHCHKSNAHLMGFLVKGFAKLPIIVRSCYDPGGLPRGLRAGMLYRFGTDGLVVISEKSKKLALAKNGFPSHAVKVVEPGIDLDRFSPARRIPVDEGEFGLGQGSFVIGIVTRIRANRRLDIVFRALQTLAPSYPQMRILLVGRGREGALEKVVEVPTREMGIFEKVAIAGYCGGDRLVAAYRAMDVLVYPTPGSDKSCRTVREAMAAGVPVIAPRIGFLPDLIDDRITGRIMDSSQESLVQILSELMQDNAELHAMGRRSLETSNRRFAPEMQAEKTLTFYENILKRWQ
jgi:glycosyltransferase involved in cell wall biosynthesis